MLDTIRANRRIGRLPEVLLTSSKEEQDVDRAYTLGANAFVVKPIEFQQFIEAITGLGIFWTNRNESPPRTDIEQPLGA